MSALKEIRAGRAGDAGILVIALTADAMAGVDASLLADDFDAVQPKPIVPAALVLALAEQIECAANSSVGLNRSRHALG